MTHSVCSGFSKMLSPESLAPLAAFAADEGSLERQPLIDHFSRPVPPMGPTEMDPQALPNRIYRFIVGLDQGFPTAMTDEESDDKLQDSFANHLLKRGVFPLTSEEVITQMKATADRVDGFKNLETFVIAEGGQIGWSSQTSGIRRRARFVFLIEMENGIGPDVMIGTGTDTNSQQTFLELMSWDKKQKAFNYYQKLQGLWIYSGNSFHAIDDETRGKGPFSGHINGGPIMKELKFPWQHWSSQSAEIPASSFHPNDPIAVSEHFINKTDAQIFETFIKGGIHHWNKSRVDSTLSNPDVLHPRKFLRQFLTSHNVNMISSPDESHSSSGSGNIRLPISFFANIEALSSLGIDLSAIGSPIQVERERYSSFLTSFQFSLAPSVPGDTHFAFFVPEVAHEDIDLLQKLVGAELLSSRLAACLLMVDFPNPIYSKKRAALQSYVPLVTNQGDGGKDLDTKFVRKIIDSGLHLDPTTAEGEFNSFWQLGEDGWKDHFASLLNNYFNNLRQQIQTPEGFEGIMRLADSRRETFKRTGLFEFPISFPTNAINKDDFPLAMQPDGSVLSG